MGLITQTESQIATVECHEELLSKNLKEKEKNYMNYSYYVYLH